MNRLPVLLATLIALTAPTAARGATVTVRPDPGKVEAPGEEPYADEVYFAAAPGETNHVTVAYAGDANSVTVTDATATLIPTGTCTMVDVHTATCVARAQATSEHLQATRVELGDGDDTVVSTRPEPGPPIGGLNAFGGTGNDTLTGSPTEDTLDGGSGTDTITGGAGNDTITDGDGDGSTDSDTLAGGGDAGDTVSYASHVAPVTVDLAASTAGVDEREDIVSGFENTTGGAGDDTLVGTADAANDLAGGPGNDTLDGRGGVSFEDTTDALSGGPGGDDLTSGAPGAALRGGLGRDAFTCAAGRNIVIEPTVDEVLARRCATVIFPLAEADSFSVPTYPKTLSARSAAFGFACPRLEARDGEPSSCRGKLVLRRAGSNPQKLGAGTIAGDGSKDSFTVTVHLKRRFRRLARRPDGVTAALQIKPGDNLPKVGWRIVLRL